jgi:hypothetical protein
MEAILRQLAEAMTAGNKELAEALICTLVDLHPEEEVAHIVAARTYNWLGQKDRCYLYAALAVALNPHSPAPYTLLAQLASKTISRRTIQRVLENGWECSNQPFLEYVWTRRSRQRRNRLHRQEIDEQVRTFTEKHHPPIA